MPNWTTNDAGDTYTIPSDYQQSIVNTVSESISAGSISDSVSGSTTDSEAVADALRWYTTTAGTDLSAPDDLLHGPLNMEQPTRINWFIDEALDMFSVDFVGSLIETDGLDGIQHEVIETASEKITRCIEDGMRAVPAFNEVAAEWPHEIRAILAAYEANEQNRTDESYNEEVERFAMSKGFLDDPPYQSGQATLDLWDDGVDPFDDNDLTTDQAIVLVALDAAGEDVSKEDVQDIDDADAFLARFYELGDFRLAQEAHHFDDRLPHDLLPDLAPPEDWPDHMDPSDISAEDCGGCDQPFFSVFTRDEGEALVPASHGSSTYERHELGEEYFSLQGTGSVVCGSCAREAQEGVLYSVHDGYTDGVAKVRIRNNLVLDEGANPFPPLSTEAADFLRSVTGAPFDDSYFELSPDPDFGPIDPQMEAMSTLRQDEVTIDNGVFILIVDAPHNCTALLPRDNPDVVRGVKERLDAAVNDEPIHV